MQYEFVTHWSFSAPLSSVWDAIYHSESWPEWWKGTLGVAELLPGDSDGIGNVRRFSWRGCLPYTLTVEMEVLRLEKFRTIEARARGELEGVGLWTFSHHGDLTSVRYDWRVSTRKPWMNILGPIAKPVFRWNHNVVMRRGERGLKNLLSAK